MRSILFLALIVALGVLLQPNRSDAQSNKHDRTMLLKRDTNGHQVFIERNPNSRYYRGVGYIGIDPLEIEAQRSFDSEIVLRGMKHFHDKLKPLLGQWTDVHKYKNRFYLYYPCDGYFQHRTVISDSAVIEIDDHDGYELYPIAKVDALSDST